MAVLVDLRHQVQQLLRRINGGTENPHGWSEGVVLRYMNNTGTTLDIGSVVRLQTGGDNNFVELQDVEEGDEVIGVVQGTYEQFGPNVGLYRIDYVKGRHRPDIRVTTDKDSGQEPLTVQFDASGSSDQDGDALSFAWDFDSNGTTDATTAVAGHTYEAPGVRP